MRRWRTSWWSATRPSSIEISSTINQRAISKIVKSFKKQNRTGRIWTQKWALWSIRRHLSIIDLKKINQMPSVDTNLNSAWSRNGYLVMSAKQMRIHLKEVSIRNQLHGIINLFNIIFKSRSCSHHFKADSKTLTSGMKQTPREHFQTTDVCRNLNLSTSCQQVQKFTASNKMSRSLYRGYPCIHVLPLIHASTTSTIWARCHSITPASTASWILLIPFRALCINNTACINTKTSASIEFMDTTKSSRRTSISCVRVLMMTSMPRNRFVKTKMVIRFRDLTLTTQHRGRSTRGEFRAITEQMFEIFARSLQWMQSLHWSQNLRNSCSSWRPASTTSLRPTTRNWSRSSWKTILRSQDLNIPQKMNMSSSMVIIRQTLGSIMIIEHQIRRETSRSVSSPKVWAVVAAVRCRAPLIPEKCQDITEDPRNHRSHSLSSTWPTSGEANPARPTGRNSSATKPREWLQPSISVTFMQIINDKNKKLNL